ncbi:ABC transporter substrate-binding protein [Cobetia sp. L2A1]|uniref:ABC transporter substrate-binding protein n=1 Tax=Cobetia sp. L2A1 TaxID=2686360 RepID=UPI0018EF1A5D|nr:ABC transporter substrate-binding protein [Cobetia sp. L2A1]
MPLKMKQLLASASLAAGLVVLSAHAEAGMIRIGLGDVASVETLAFMVALERAKEQGLEYELTTFSKEELAIQAMISGQIDVGIGSPYSIIQKSNIPVRNFFQLSKLVFYPVVSNDYKTWQDLDGQPYTFHARGTGTEAIVDIIAEREGITLGDRSYVPGSENRIVAMIRGQVKASIVDLANKNLLLKQAGDRFHVLPGLKDAASDELLFADRNWVASHEDDVDLLVKSLLKTWREMVADPTIINKERERFGLLEDLPHELLEEVDSYYAEAVAAGVFDPEGGGEKAARSDLAFFSHAGQLEGSAETLKIEDFWELGPLEKARQSLGE